MSKRIIILGSSPAVIAGLFAAAASVLARESGLMPDINQAQDSLITARR